MNTDYFVFFVSGVDFRRFRRGLKREVGAVLIPRLKSANEKPVFIQLFVTMSFR